MTYQPTGRKLNAAEAEVVGILSEECSEVAIAVSKMVRFGHGNVNPRTGECSQTELALEIGDLKFMIAILEAIPDFLDHRRVRSGMGRKHDKLLEYGQSIEQDPAVLEAIRTAARTI